MENRIYSLVTSENGGTLHQYMTREELIAEIEKLPPSTWNDIRVKIGLN